MTPVTAESGIDKLEILVSYCGAQSFKDQITAHIPRSIRGPEWRGVEAP
jgi:hypothetical protein